MPQALHPDDLLDSPALAALLDGPVPAPLETHECAALKAEAKRTGDEIGIWREPGSFFWTIYRKSLKGGDGASFSGGKVYSCPFCKEIIR